jgi:hypothetical protein
MTKSQEQQEDSFLIIEELNPGHIITLDLDQVEELAIEKLNNLKSKRSKKTLKEEAPHKTLSKCSKMILLEIMI